METALAQIWPVLQPIFAVCIGVIAWLAKQSVVRAERSNIEIRDAIDGLRREFAASNLQSAVTAERQVAHQAQDDLRFQQIYERFDRVQAELGTRVLALENHVIRHTGNVT